MTLKETLQNLLASKNIGSLSLQDIEEQVKNHLKNKLDVSKYRRTSVDVTESLFGVEISILSLKVDRTTVKTDMFLYYTSPVEQLDEFMEAEIEYLNSHYNK